MVVPFTGTVAGIYLWDRQLTASEIEEDYRRGLLLPFHTSSQVRVAVEKPEPSPATTSLYYDATQLDGLDFVSNLNLSNSPDNACVQGSVKFLREQENLSLAYLKNDTKLNLADDSTYNVERFLDVYRQIRIFAATVPLGLDASGDDFWYMLDGRIDLIDWGTEEITVNFRDKGGLLVDTFIEDEVGYGTTLAVPPSLLMMLLMALFLTTLLMVERQVPMQALAMSYTTRPLVRRGPLTIRFRSVSPSLWPSERLRENLVTTLSSNGTRTANHSVSSFMSPSETP